MQRALESVFEQTARLAGVEDAEARGAGETIEAAAREMAARLSRVEEPALGILVTELGGPEAPPPAPEPEEVQEELELNSPPSHLTRVLAGELSQIARQADAPLDPTRAGHEAHCRVVLRQGDQEFTGVGEGSNTPQGRAEAAARALFASLAATRGRDDVALEDAAVVETVGRSFVMVSARGLAGRQSVPLTGAAAVARSPEEAAILASLQATNRWTQMPE